MWKNYLITSLRAAGKNKFYIGVNLFSLAIAFSLCTIGYFNYEFNDTFNTYFGGAENLYKINGRSAEANKNLVGTTPFALKELLDQNVNLQTTRFDRKQMTIKLGDRLFEETVGFIDPEFFDMFSYQFIHGQGFKSEHDDQVVLTEKLAMRLFGKTDVIGEFIQIIYPNQQEVTYTVEGVAANSPRNLSFIFSMLMPMETYFNAHQISSNSWENWVHGTFVRIEDPSQIETVRSTLESSLAIQNTKNKGLEFEGYSIDSILEWPKFESKLYKSSFMGHLHPASVFGTLSSAIAILLLACFNYINTSIALSTKRLKEIGLRKIVGGLRSNIIIQFLLENTTLILGAFLFSFLISYWLIPPYNAMFEMDIVSFEFVAFGKLILVGVLVLILVIILSSAYPALYVSKFESLEILRNRVKLAGSNWLFKSLLAFQFMICFYNVFSLFVFIDNGEYQKHLDRGYQVNHTINIQLNEPDQFTVLRDRLSQNPAITSISGTQHLVGFHTQDETLSFRAKDHQIALLKTGKDYIKSLGIRLASGSFFETEYYNGYNHIIINQMLQNQLGEELLGKHITIGEDQFLVVGVVDDFNIKPIIFDNRIRPTVIQLIPKESYQIATITTNTLSDQKLDELMQETWYSLFPQQLYRGFMQEEVMKSIRQTNHIIININSSVAVISLLISVLGLYTLISLTIQKRIKEFGIRKVLGASPGTILRLIHKDIIVLLLISASLGLSGAYFVIGSIMDTIYAYHIEISIIHMVLPFLIIGSIILMSIGYKSMRTAKLNPVMQLRME